MQRIETSLPGVLELRRRVFRDERGFFTETYHEEHFAGFGIHESFVQDNLSLSVKGTLRGLHYQLQHAQAKVCFVVEGEALDVAVDIRVGSPHFGKWTSMILSAEAHNQIYIPAGFAHGFLARTEKVQFVYKCGDYYAAADEHGIAWNDPQLNIAWGVSGPLVSGKDSKLPNLADVPRELLPRYGGS